MTDFTQHAGEVSLFGLMAGLDVEYEQAKARLAPERRAVVDAYLRDGVESAAFLEIQRDPYVQDVLRLGARGERETP